MAAASHQAMNHNAPVTESDFRSACGLFPTGVTVVARTLSDGSPYGMTVSSFTSVSLSPPLVLVCIDKSARFLQDLPAGAAISINILSEQQQHLATRFANRKDEDRFAGAQWHTGWHEVPLLDGVVATFGCLVTQVLESGDHFILIAEVFDIQRHKGSPLVWCDRNYHALPARHNPQL
jgi:flavin reductase (DIM6/NTAB) family NADH-FMN oxidoreductase RutF